MSSTPGATKAATDSPGPVGDSDAHRKSVAFEELEPKKLPGVRAPKTGRPPEDSSPGSTSRAAVLPAAAVEASLSLVHTAERTVDFLQYLCFKQMQNFLHSILPT